MEPKELRIGNFVGTDNGIGLVQTIVLSLVNNGIGLGAFGIEENEIKVIKYEDCTPIPLTEDWLSKFDFIQEDNQWAKGYVRLGEIDGSFYFDSMRDGIVDIAYIHQLQNLAFAINQKEVTEDF